MTAPTNLLKQAKDRRNIHVPPPKLPTIDDARKMIPPHCFEKNLLTSIRYLVQDLLILAGLYIIVPYVEHYFGWIGYLGWCWVFGICGSSLFVVGHDCGHGSFSEYEWVNDLCGHIAHAPILAPYWPWQKSHRQHHQYTSHLDKDKGHPWVTEEKFMQRTALEKYLLLFHSPDG
ncbi:acetyltransferase [Parelaphostrongylus tenuis]|uniref:Acetyltransferase n=1 Tax=Parelaphostrongylus tenuis TaxID=148309 RepID=A0AAD5QQV1_PARTN|nr:acetyltransferase [Parelaphostrongylus tenuis]